MNKRIPISGVIIPLLYFLSGFVLIFFNVSIHESFFNSISIFKFSYNFISMGIFCVIFSIIYRRLFTKYREVYIEFLGLFALFQFIWTLYCCFLFYEFRTPYFLYGAVIAFSFFYLLMYERRIFKK